MVQWADKEAAIQALERHGRVDPNDLIAAAKDTRHPCHDDFTWDIAQAAGERWRDQARWLIRKCKFSVVVESVTLPVVQYVSSRDEEGDVFVSLPKMRGKATTTDMMLTELNMLAGLVARIRGIALSKQNIIGPNVVKQLGIVLGIVEALQAEME